MGICEIVISDWLEDVASINLEYSPALLCTTTASLMVCFATCTQQPQSKAVTFNQDSMECSCFDSLTNMASQTGNRVWKRMFKDYTYNPSLGIYSKVVNNVLLSHEEAASKCATEGGRLIVLDTFEKFDFIRTSPDCKYEEYYHIGATDKVTEGIFIWSTGGIVNLGSPFWAEYQPDNYLGDQNCVALHKSAFDDVECYINLRYICEIS